MSPRRSLPLPNGGAPATVARRDDDAVLAPADFCDAPWQQQSGAAHEMTPRRPSRQRATRRRGRLLGTYGRVWKLLADRAEVLADDLAVMVVANGREDWSLTRPVRLMGNAP